VVAAEDGQQGERGEEEDELGWEFHASVYLCAGAREIQSMYRLKPEAFAGGPHHLD
jgi:hypothetical protein